MWAETAWHTGEWQSFTTQESEGFQGVVMKTAGRGGCRQAKQKWDIPLDWLGEYIQMTFSG